eukprot:TRINITY_DN13897_c0_g1_i1.p1 TRINITY_DN13897_c0_g1~~TRINITY_DN13897_c0_g1_i1.p1  ORF type:complete len:233 (+),score=29.52 TRINITY_DN13897_c0_g1_i1:50-748(+)
MKRKAASDNHGETKKVKIAQNESEIDNKDEPNKVTVTKETGVPGLFLVTDLLSETEEKELLESIEKETWKPNRTKSRKIQMYGPWHDQNYVVAKSPTVTPFPQYTAWLVEKIKNVTTEFFPELNLKNSHLGNEKMCELFVNHYFKDSGLRFHMDHRTTYLEVILGVSLASDCHLSFQQKKQQVPVFIPRRSLYIMTGDSRYKWKHGILPTNGVLGEERISLTFRMVNPKKMR